MFFFSKRQKEEPMMMRTLCTFWWFVLNVTGVNVSNPSSMSFSRHIVMLFLIENKCIQTTVSLPQLLSAPLNIPSPPDPLPFRFFFGKEQAFMRQQLNTSKKDTTGQGKNPNIEAEKSQTHTLRLLGVPQIHQANNHNIGR